ncbi:hypothetical protein BOH78_3488 [Pichia kudriavzevii]|uniref:2,5-diamino-6-ribosylamino-4(3H)-pyrimidinone 5'-phosphate reductase n=1 Tax=Pichia kudriavzevii TaxID=4909 RepID=A0A1V2LKD9_PICKU|nr:dihydrofolate reductase family protein [Lacticaseibacillus paracasei]ONH72971.1 hypothetical protein BOH78_3488 [Pichia kudriavzevii]
MSALLPLPEDIKHLLEEYLPGEKSFLTLTYAQSLDSRVSAGPGLRTVISHEQTKTMTHYIRAHHDAIVVGISTFLADNPSLNCRYNLNKHKIRPVIIDPHFKSSSKLAGSKIVENYTNGTGLKPLIVVSRDVNSSSTEEFDVVHLKCVNGRFPWEIIVKKLHELGLPRIMVEGGAYIINSLLTEPKLVDSLIITIGPVFLGENGVSVSPGQNVTLENIKWWTGIQDSVICATLK